MISIVEDRSRLETPMITCNPQWLLAGLILTISHLLNHMQSLVRYFRYFRQPKQT